MREWDLPRQAAELHQMKAAHDKPENRVVHDGEAICRVCRGPWDELVHGC